MRINRINRYFLKLINIYAYNVISFQTLLNQYSIIYTELVRE